MITKKEYNNKQAIEDDKENFINYALGEIEIEGIEIEEIWDFISYYQNLISFEENLKELNKFRE